MELFVAIIQAYSTMKEAAQAYEHVSDWVFEKVSQLLHNKPTATIERQVEKIARASDDEIRKAVSKYLVTPANSAIPDAKREELTGVLLNITRNIRYRTAYGSMSGSSLRSERLLEFLVRGIEPIRHQNEPVTANSPWILRRHLGMGSFGEVWMAENPGYPIPRAYKFFINDGSGEWLRREQKNLVALLNRLGGHDHIVKLVDVQTEKCDYPFLAFEYMAGGSLEEWIIKDQDKRPNLEPSEIIRQVVVGLAAAHAQMIAHRDIKPANILMTAGPDVRIKIGDFGLAKVANSQRDGQSQLASIAGTVGTRLYLPPESQQRSIRRSPPQDDVFALGVVWYQLVVNAIERPPYDFADRLRSVGLDSHTIGLIERCLAHPDRRFKDAREVAAALVDSVPPLTVCPAGLPDVQHLAREYLSTLTY